MLPQLLICSVLWNSALVGGLVYCLQWSGHIFPEPGAIQKSNQTVKSGILGPAQWDDEWPTYLGLLHEAAMPMYSLRYENRTYPFTGRLNKIVTSYIKLAYFKTLILKVLEIEPKCLEKCFTIEL